MSRGARDVLSSLAAATLSTLALGVHLAAAHVQTVCQSQTRRLPTTQYHHCPLSPTTSQPSPTTITITHHHHHHHQQPVNHHPPPVNHHPPQLHQSTITHHHHHHHQLTLVQSSPGQDEVRNVDIKS